jgi:hypothetical protein
VAYTSIIGIVFSSRPTRPICRFGLPLAPTV